MNISLIEQAASLAGSQAALARHLGVTPVFVNQMIAGVRGVPARLCKPIEALTDGAITAEMLRPDIFGPAGDGNTHKPAA